MGAVLFRLVSMVQLMFILAIWAVTMPVILTYFAINTIVDRLATPKASCIPKPGDAVLITGASSGIGLSAAKRLQHEGFHVIAGVRNEKDFEGLAKLKMDPIVLDIKNSDAILKAVKTVENQLQNRRLAAIVNNAGVIDAGPFECTSPDREYDVIDTNLLGDIRMTRSFLPLLRKHQGRVVFVGSVNGHLPALGMATYVASKFAIRGLAYSLSQELEPVGVSVSLIEPAQTVSSIFGKAQDAISETANKVPEYYGIGQIMDLYMSYVAPKTAADPRDSTDQCIVHAVKARSPLLLYLPNWTAILTRVAALIPSRVAPGRVAGLVFRAVHGQSSGWTRSH